MGDMVSRDRRPEPPHTTPLEALFGAWRKLLSALLARLGHAVRTVISATRSALRAPARMTADARAGSPSERVRLSLLFGFAALAISIGLNIILAPPENRVRALANALVAAAWVAARLPAMRLATSRPGSSEVPTVIPSWAAGAVVHVAALSPGLRVVTWVAGAVLSYRMLRSSGRTVRDAAVIAAAGYGLEVAGFALLALTRSLTVAMFLLGGATG